MATNISKQGVVSADGSDINENLFIGTPMSSDVIANFVANNSTDWTKPFRHYNGSVNNHTFENGIDTVLLSSTGNLGISFARKATDINLDSNSYYTISCEAMTTKASAHIDIGLSYYTTANAWVWRGGSNPKYFTATNTWEKFSHTFKPDADTQYLNYCFTMTGASSGTDTFCIRHCKLEKGSVATMWQPSPNDTIYIGATGKFNEAPLNAKVAKGYFEANQFYEI